jgi:hypothetical protein
MGAPITEEPMKPIVEQPMKEIIKYEDDHVKLTDTELILKSRTGGGTNVIKLSTVEGVHWENDSLLKKANFWWWMKSGSTVDVTTEADENDSSVNNGKKKKSKKQMKKENRKAHRFVVVAEKIKGNPEGYGFSVVNDPLQFHRQICPERYAPKKSSEDGGGEKKMSLIKRISHGSKENLLALASSASHAIKRITSKGDIQQMSEESSSKAQQTLPQSLTASSSSTNIHQPSPFEQKPHFDFET